MKVYFIHKGSEETGPYTIEELKLQGITRDTPVWREELPDWLNAGDLPELNALFISHPPPFVQKEFTAPPASPELKAPPPLKEGVITEPISKKNYLLYIASAIVLLIAAGIYFYFNNGKQKADDVKEEKIVASLIDPSAKKEATQADTTKKINLDTLSNWMNTDTITGNKSIKASNDDGFTMGGIPVKKSKEADKANPKKKDKKEDAPLEEKQPENKTNVSTQTKETAPVKAKNLLINGSFRKNLILEAVLEGRIQNPNDNIPFRDIVITVEFLGSDGASLGSKRFSQAGSIRGGESVPFKFKAVAPKGSKTARYNVSGTSF